MFNPAAPAQALHMLIAAYQVTGFAVAGVYAVGILRKRNDKYHRRGVLLGMILATAMIPLQAIVGSWIGEMLARQQPEKLAALEGLFQTTAGAPLTLFGWVDASTQKVYFAITIPKLLSLLSFNQPDATVTGLDAYPRTPGPAYRSPIWPSTPWRRLVVCSCLCRSCSGSSITVNIVRFQPRAG